MATPGPQGGQYQPLSEDQIKQIHQASLTVLRRTGIHVENEEALSLYRQGGAPPAASCPPEPGSI